MMFIIMNKIINRQSGEWPDVLMIGKEKMLACYK